MEVMKSYIKAGGYHLLAMIVLGHVAFIVFQILTNMWLSSWSEDPPFVNGTYDRSQVDFRLGVYGALGAGQCKTNIFSHCTERVADVRVCSY